MKKPVFRTPCLLLILQLSKHPVSDVANCYLCTQGTIDTIASKLTARPSSSENVGRRTFFCLRKNVGIGQITIHTKDCKMRFYGMKTLQHRHRGMEQGRGTHVSTRCFFSLGSPTRYLIFLLFIFYYFLISFILVYDQTGLLFINISVVTVPEQSKGTFGCRKISYTAQTQEKYPVDKTEKPNKSIPTIYI